MCSSHRQCHAADGRRLTYYPRSLPAFGGKEPCFTCSSAFRCLYSSMPVFVWSLTRDLASYDSRLLCRLVCSVRTGRVRCRWWVTLYRSINGSLLPGGCLFAPFRSLHSRPRKSKLDCGKLANGLIVIGRTANGQWWWTFLICDVLLTILYFKVLYLACY